MKRFVCLVLSLVVVLAMFSACGDNGSNTEDGEDVLQNVVNQNTVPNYLKGLDYDDQRVVIHSRGDQNTINEIGLEDQGDILTNALWKRTLATEARLGVDIELAPQDGWSKYNITVAALRQSINSGISEYDIIAGWSPRVAALIFEGLFYDLNEFEQYEAEEVWWSKSVTEALTIQGSLYFTTGDISTTYMDCCSSLLVNEAVSTAFGYTYESFYDVVYSGEWTMDYLYELTKQTYTDKNGNDLSDDGDVFGLLIGSSYRDCFWTSCNISIIENNGEDLPRLNYDIEYVQNVSEKVYKLLFENVGCLPTASDLPQIFLEDRSMFIFSLLGDLSTYASGMTTKYGVLPVPKYDSNQENYRTFVQQGMTFFGIPVDAHNSEMSCAVISSLGYDSHEIVIIPHYETLLKTRYVKDSTSGYMIDIIYNGIWMNFDSVYTEALGDSLTKSEAMPTYIYRLMKAGEPPNIAGWWEEQGEGLQTRLDNLISSVSE